VKPDKQALQMEHDLKQQYLIFQEANLRAASQGQNAAASKTGSTIVTSRTVADTGMKSSFIPLATKVVSG